MSDTRQEWAAFTKIALKLPGPEYPDGCEDGYLPADAAIVVKARDHDTFDAQVAAPCLAFDFIVQREHIDLVMKVKGHWHWQ